MVWSVWGITYHCLPRPWRFDQKVKRDPQAILLTLRHLRAVLRSNVTQYARFSCIAHANVIMLISQLHSLRALA